MKSFITFAIIALALTACEVLPEPFSKSSQCGGVKAFVGMTRSALIAACGKPKSINVHDAYGSKSEQVVYNLSDIIYVRDGKVESMQFTIH